MAQALTNKKFIEQMDDVIEELGGTPTNLQLTADKEDDMLSNGAFAAKMDEVVEALGGTPAELTISNDEADDMVSDHIFQLKMEDVVKNMSGGGGGGSSDLETATLTIDLSAAPSMASISSITFPVCDNIDEDHDVATTNIFYFTQLGGDSYSFTIPLYKGKAYIEDYSNANFTATETLTPVYQDEDRVGYYLTGNGTLTLTSN